MGELKPCPFCGETPLAESCFVADENQGTKWGGVVCQCGVKGPEVRTGYDLAANAPWHETAAEEWNRRATPPQPVTPAGGEVMAWMNVKYGTLFPCVVLDPPNVAAIEAGELIPLYANPPVADAARRDDAQSD